MTQPAALSRRRLLSGLAISATAAATGALPGHASPVAENPALITLGDQLPALASEHVAAKASYDQLRSAARKVWPRASEEITYWGSQCVPENFIDGSGYKEGRKLLTEAAIDDEVTHARKEAQRLLGLGGSIRAGKAHRKNDWADRMGARRPAVKAYWAETARLHAEFDFENVNRCYRETQEALRQHVSEIMMCREETLAGVVIKAQALAAWSHTDRFRKAFNELAPGWSDAIAASIMRQAEPSGRPSGTGQ